MGATDTTRKYNMVPKDVLENMVERDRQDMIDEYGNDAYSGTWGAKEGGVTFISKTATTEDEAWELFTEGKWGQVNAVKIVPKNFVSKTTKDNRLTQLNSELEELNNQKKDMIKKFLSDRQSSRKTVTCIKCKAKTDASIVTVSKTCPKCNKVTFFVSQTEQKKIDTQNKRIKAMKDKIEARKRALKIDTKSMDKLQKEMQDLLSKYNVAISKEKAVLKGFHTCKGCKSRINTDRIWDDSKKNTCPVCSEQLTNNSKKYDSWRYMQDIRAISEKITSLTGEYWYVGGMCPY